MLIKFALIPNVSYKSRWEDTKTKTSGIFITVKLSIYKIHIIQMQSCRDRKFVFFIDIMNGSCYIICL